MTSNDNEAAVAAEYQYPEKYASYIKAGLSRQYIEASLRDDGYTIEDIEEFWVAVNQKAIAEACSDATVPLTDVWKSLKKFQTILPYEPASRSEEKSASPGHLRVVCLSDTHGLHDNVQHIPSGDILLHAGDFTDTGDRAEVVAFNKFLGRLPHRYKVVIAGNHESSFDEAFYSQHWQDYGHKRKHDSVEVRSLLTNGVYLEDQLVVVNGIRIYGTPWQPAFCQWAFNLKRGKELQEKWKRIPEDVDILLTHTPPLGRGDEIRDGSFRTGDVDLLREIQERVVPKFHVFGHVHEGYGCSTDGTTVFINASICTHTYDPTNKPVVFDIPIPTPTSSSAAAAANENDVLYEELIVKAKRMRKAIRRQVSFQIESSPDDLSHLKVVGTESDRVFNNFLESKSSNVNENRRAMKYLFHRGIAQEFEEGKHRYAKEPRSEPTRVVVLSKDPDYTIRRRPAKTLRGKLCRRVTLSVLDMSVMRIDDTEEEKVVIDTKVAASQTRPPGFRKSPLVRRDGVADLPLTPPQADTTSIVVESDCIMCKYDVDGHRCSNTSNTTEVRAPVVDEQPPREEKEECIMCKYKVSGHQCKSSNDQNEPSSITEESVVAKTTTENAAEKKKPKALREFSSWF